MGWLRLVGSSKLQVSFAATISRLLKITGLFCKRDLEKKRYSAKETYNLKEPTNRRHRIECVSRRDSWVHQKKLEQKSHTQNHNFEDKKIKSGHVQVEAIKYIFSSLDEPSIVEGDLRALAPNLFAPQVCVCVCVRVRVRVRVRACVRQIYVRSYVCTCAK